MSWPLRPFADPSPTSPKAGKDRLLALGVLILLALPGTVAAECATPAGYAILVSPRSPVPGDTLRVLVAMEEPPDRATVHLAGPDGKTPLLAVGQGGGPPYWVAGQLPAATVGNHQLLV